MSRRKLSVIASCVLLICVPGILFLWVQSYRCVYSFGFEPKHGDDWNLESGEGAIYVHLSRPSPAATRPSTSWEFQRLPRGFSLDEAAYGVNASRWLGVHVFDVTLRFDAGPTRFVVLSYWVLFALASAGASPLFIAAVRGMRRRGRWARGLCTNCGYDLRATPDRCPECGQAKDEKNNSHGFKDGKNC